MATPTAAVPKVKGEFTVSYQTKEGSYKSITVEKEFGPPEEDTEVTVNVTSDDGAKQSQVVRKFKRVTISSIEEALEWLNDSKRAWTFINGAIYGMDLWARNALKAPIAAEEEGPGRVIAKMAEDIMKGRAKLGRPISKEAALAKAQKEYEEVLAENAADAAASAGSNESAPLEETATSA